MTASKRAVAQQFERRTAPDSAVAHLVGPSSPSIWAHHVGQFSLVVDDEDAGPAAMYRTPAERPAAGGRAAAISVDRQAESEALAPCGDADLQCQLAARGHARTVRETARPQPGADAIRLGW